MGLRFDEEILGPLDVTRRISSAVPDTRRPVPSSPFLSPRASSSRSSRRRARKRSGPNHATEPFGAGDRVVKKWVVVLADWDTD